MMKDNLRKILVNGLGIISALGLLACFYIYRTLQAGLIPANPVPSDEIYRLGGFPLPILVITAIYHLILLVYVLQRYRNGEGRLFLRSLYLVVLIFSGINLLTDYTILTDIGHEYLYWDISAYWTYLYLCNAFHLGTVVIGLVLFRQAPALQLRGLFNKIRQGDDTVFRSIHQIGLISALVGLVGVIWVLLVDITEKYQAGYVLTAVVFALFPWVSMVVYWAIRNGRKPVREWMDEKQFSDMAFGALFMAFFCMPLIIVLATLSALHIVNFPAYAWLMLVFIAMLLIYSMVMVLKNRQDLPMEL